MNIADKDLDDPRINHYYALHGCLGIPYMVIPGESPDRDIYRFSIGNCFKTKTEAEKVIEKLQAFKRLKDIGFEFTGVAAGSRNISFRLDTMLYDPTDFSQIEEDLHLLFDESNKES